MNRISVLKEKFKEQRSIRQLLMLIFLFLIGIVVLQAAVILRLTIVSTRNVISEKDKLIASSISAAFSSNLDKILDNFRLIEEIHAYENFHDDILFRAFIESNPVFSSIYLVNKDKRIESVYPENDELIDFDASRLPAIDGLKNAEEFISDTFTDFLSNHASVQIARKHREHYLVGNIDLLTFVNEFGNLPAFSDGEVSIIDHRGKYIIHRDSSLVAQQETSLEFLKHKQPGKFMYREHNKGIEYQVTATPISRTEWYVLLWRSLREQNEPILQIAQYLVVIFLIGGICISLLFRNILRRILFNTDQIIKQIRQTGEISTREGSMTYSITEFDDISKTFSSMQGTIKKNENRLRLMNESLESLVEKRTNSLFEAEKLAVLGRLMGSVAHEINTPLGAIRSSNNIISGYSATLINLLLGDEILCDNRARDAFIGIIAKIKTGYIELPDRKETKKLEAECRAAGMKHAADTAVSLVDMGFRSLLGGLSEEMEKVVSLDIFEQLVQKASVFSAVLRASDIISESVEKADYVIQALRNYMHGESVRTAEKINIARSMENVLRLFYNKIKYNVELKKNIAEDVFIMGHPAQIQQIWMNLIGNALDAMDYSGNLLITVEKTDQSAIIAITDSGKGIDQSVQKKIFEPFFTTKKSGAGIGLGLNIVQNIINNHDGTIEVDSVPGKTTFKIMFPALG